MDRTIWTIFPDAGADHEVCCADQSASVDNGAKPQAHAFQFKFKGEGKQSPRFALFNLQAPVNDMVEAHLCQILAALAGDQREIHRQAEPRRHCLRSIYCFSSRRSRTPRGYPIVIPAEIADNNRYINAINYKKQGLSFMALSRQVMKISAVTPMFR